MAKVLPEYLSDWTTDKGSKISVVDLDPVDLFGHLDPAKNIGSGFRGSKVLMKKF